MSEVPPLPIDEMLSADVIKAETDPRPLYWERLTRMDAAGICAATGAQPVGEGVLALELLDQELFFDLNEKQITDSTGRTVNDLLTDMVLLLYLHGPQSQDEPRRAPLPPGRVISPLQLPTGATFFRGPHVIPTAPLEAQFGSAPDAFLAAGKSLGGRSWERGDASFILEVLPHVDMVFVLYIADEEFPAKANLLVGETIDHYLTLDAVWGLCNVVVKRLLKKQYG